MLVKKDAFATCMAGRDPYAAAEALLLKQRGPFSKVRSAVRHVISEMRCEKSMRNWANCY